MLVFDIETSRRPDSELRRLIPPFDPASVDVPTGEFDPSVIKLEVNGEFDPSTVKLGALKDQAKIEAKIQSAKDDYAAAVIRDTAKVHQAMAEFEQRKADAPRILAEAEEAHFASCTAKAALSAVLGRVRAIGCLGTENGQWSIQYAHTDGEELLALNKFWQKYLACRRDNRLMVGFNICGFDLPFMVRRSWLLGVPVPDTLITNDRYYDRVMVDLLAKWKCGNYGDSIRLGALAQFFDVGGKPDGVSGADFARLLDEDPDAAEQYLLNDLRMTAACAQRMGYV